MRRVASNNSTCGLLLVPNFDVLTISMDSSLHPKSTTPYSTKFLNNSNLRCHLNKRISKRKCNSHARKKRNHEQKLALKHQIDYDYNEFMISLNPKQETGVLEFLRENPTADGRGIVIAILDTGVDPGAEGLKITTDEKIKVIERYDCTGSGDVDTSEIVKLSSDGKITALSGRIFKVPPWDNPTNEYHIGFKPIFHLYPDDLIQRMTEERRDKSWNPFHQKAIAEAEKALSDYYKKVGSTSGVNESTDKPKNEKGKLVMEDQFMEVEKISRVEVLLQLDKSQIEDDNGPFLDCILFKNSSDEWQIYLISSDVDELDQAILLHEYNLYHEYSPLSFSDRFNISVNIWKDGNLLEIVGLSETHGTHVAAIAAAYFPNSPQLNGVAPGAQIISLTIGDNRLDTCAFDTPFIRAISRICNENERRMHIINTSYGGADVWPPAGKIAQMMRDVVDKKGVIWVSSAGNEGPVLTSVCHPATLSFDCIIGVGAYVSPQMKTAHSQTRQPGKGMSYTWCSRGPSLNGILGVNICAPGGAVTTVPTYSLMGSDYMNGTSMSAPHSAGCIALMLSLALQRNIDWTPYSIKRSLQATAISIDILEPFSQGFGLIQIPNAYRIVEYLSHTFEKFVRFNIICSGGLPGHDMQGIYIRDPKLEKPQEYSVQVTPIFFDSDVLGPSIKTMFRKRLSLRSFARWIEIPPFFDIFRDEPRTFVVRVDSTGLSPGVYYNRIDAVDPNMPGTGALFSVDVTLIIPIPISYYPADMKPRVHFGSWAYAQGEVKRYFIEAPPGATWGVLRLKRLDPCTGKQILTRFNVQTATILPGDILQPELENFELMANDENKITFEVHEGKIVEIAIARWWSSESENDGDLINLSASVKFRGIKILQGNELATSTFDAFYKVDLLNLISTEEVTPSVTFTHQNIFLKPHRTSMASMAAREQIPSLQKIIYEFRADYTLKLKRSSNISVTCPLMGHFLNDGECVSAFWMLFNERKQYITAGIYGETACDCEIPKGLYNLRLQVCHEDGEKLSKTLKIPSSYCPLSCDERIYSNCTDDMRPRFVMLISMELESEITLACATSLYEILQFNEDDSGNKYKSSFPITLKKNEFLTCYMNTTLNEKTLKDFPSSSTTAFLLGEFSASNHRAGKYYCNSNVKLYFPQKNEHEDNSNSSSSSSDGDDSDENSDEENDENNEFKFLLDISSLEAHLKDLEKIDSSVEFAMGKEYYGLATRILLHRKKTHLKDWNKIQDSKLRTCFEQLGWTHCIYFLNSNSIIENPEEFRPF